MSRCTGHCCEGFGLNVTAEQLRTMERRGDVEAQKVLAMILPDGPERWSCRHLQAGGDCGVYEQRPAMCRAYGAGGCSRAGCTLRTEELSG